MAGNPTVSPPRRAATNAGRERADAATRTASAEARAQAAEAQAAAAASRIAQLERRLAEAQHRAGHSREELDRARRQLAQTQARDEWLADDEPDRERPAPVRARAVRGTIAGQRIATPFAMSLETERRLCVAVLALGLVVFLLVLTGLIGVRVI